MIRIRRAELQDYYGIWQVHASDIDDWVNADGDVNMTVFRNTSMAERWQKGGAWMSPETCAIHLNALLLGGHTPLVAVKTGRVVGETELFIGDDARIGGKTANISVLYTHRQNRGQGLGSALLKEAIRRVKALGCQYVSVFNPSPDAEPLYRRFGMVEELVQQQVLLHCQDAKLNDTSFTQTPLPNHDKLAGIPLQIGYFQSSLQCWQQLQWSLAPGTYALPLIPVSGQMVVSLERCSHSALLCFRPLGAGDQAQVYLWSRERPEIWVEPIMAWGKRLKFKQLVLLCDTDVAVKLHQRYGGELSTRQKRLVGRLT